MRVWLRAAPAALTLLGSAAYCSRATCEDNKDMSGSKQHLRQMAQRWILEEEAAGYKPPSASWPRKQPRPSEVPQLRAALHSCGGIDRPECHATAFTLAAALLGGSLFGHPDHEAENEAVTEEAERLAAAEGIALLRALVAHDSADGACGLAFCYLDGPGELARDERAAAQLFERAAAAGHAQAQCELGTMFYLADGVPEDVSLAVRYFRRAAAGGVPAAMYLLGECLLEARGCESADAAEAHSWFVAAAELGHRGARSRIIDAAFEEDQSAAVAEDGEEWRRYAQSSRRPAGEQVGAKESSGDTVVQPVSRLETITLYAGRCGSVYTVHTFGRIV